MAKERIDTRPKDVRRTLHFFWRATKEHGGTFALAVLATLIYVGLLSYANPFIIARIVDHIAIAPPEAGHIWQAFGTYIIAFIVINVVGQVASKLQDYAVWKLQIKVVYTLSTRSFDTLSNQSLAFHNAQFGGALVAQTTKFTNAYIMLLENLIYSIIPMVASIVFTVCFLATILPWFAVVLLVLAIVYILVVYWMFKTILPLNRKAAHAQITLSGVLSDSVTNILSVKTAGRESFERHLFDQANKEVVKTDSRRMVSSTLRGLVSLAVVVAMMTALIFFAVGGNAYFQISPGDVVLLFTYTYAMVSLLGGMNLLFQQVNHSFGDAYEMTRILDEPLLVADDENAPDLVVSRGDIHFAHLSFAYQAADAASKENAQHEGVQVFSDLSLHIPAGQHVGLVGASGAGKTTLITLLLRLANIQQGQIMVDGQDIAHVTQTSLRRNVAYVPQEPLLFHRSIADNIAYGRPNTTQARIEEAAAKANALEFIQQLPDGFDTMVGERGGTLSGGQRQRIAIARAILEDAPILVLDEATSALDSLSEKMIQDALVNLMEGRTSIIIAHRLSTIAALDRIVVLDKGAIIEDGTHEELLKKQGVYTQLWNRQSGSFLGQM